MGRAKKEARNPVSIKVPINLLEKIDDLAHSHRRDRTSEIVVAIEQYIEREERGSDQYPDLLQSIREKSPEYRILLKAITEDIELEKEHSETYDGE